jgi:hypothetical protein
MYAACPAEHNVLRDEIEHFQEGFVVWKNGFSLSNLAKLAMGGSLSSQRPAHFRVDKHNPYKYYTQ